SPLVAPSPFCLSSDITSWEIKMNDLDEKDVDEFKSNGFKCPTCFAVMGRKCDNELKWCTADKIKCVEFSGIINTGLKDIAVEMKKCIRPDLCKEMITYMGFPIANESKNCRSAIRNGARVRPPTSLFFVLFLEKSFIELLQVPSPLHF
uniref:UPAR/Ly6 domain-containing protein n=1 Tax=Neovison vison TaxID=452646 RepID=A0A8C7AE73_NEOVI